MREYANECISYMPSLALHIVVSLLVDVTQRVVFASSSRSYSKRLKSHLDKELCRNDFPHRVQSIKQGQQKSIELHSKNMTLRSQNYSFNQYVVSIDFAEGSLGKAKMNSIIFLINNEHGQAPARCCESLFFNTMVMTN